MVDAVGKDLQHVEPHVHIGAAGFHYKKPRDVAVAFLLMALHRLGGRAEFFGEARFHFAENHGIAVYRRDVRLAEGRYVVGF